VREARSRLQLIHKARISNIKQLRYNVSIVTTKPEAEGADCVRAVTKEQQLAGVTATESSLNALPCLSDQDTTARAELQHGLTHLKVRDLEGGNAGGSSRSLG
jgi:hypothetical protein